MSSLSSSDDPFADNTSSSFSKSPSSGSSSNKSTSSAPSSGGSSSPSSTTSSTSSSSSSGATDSSAPGTVGTSTSNSPASKSGTTSGTTNSGGTTSGGTAADNAVIPDTPVATTTSTSVPLPTSTSTTSTSQLPTSTSTSTSATPTSTSTSSYTTSTSSSSTPAPTPTATSTTASHTHTVISSTDHTGGVVIMTQTIFNPVSTSLPGGTHTNADTTGPNIGAIIGGIAGGLVGVILLTWLILIPIRKRAALKKEVDWMAFGSENDHHNDDSNNDSIYRSPRAGVGEVEAKAMDSPEMYAMSDITSAAHQGTLYSHLDANGSSNWAGPGVVPGDAYHAANNVVGAAPPGQAYDPGYAAYYPAAITVQQQQQQPQQFASYPSYSDHGSPEIGAQRYAGGQQQQHLWPTKSTSSHGHQPSIPPINNYPFAPPTVVSGPSMSRNTSLNDRVLLSHGNSFSASTVTAHDGNALSRNTSDQARMAPMNGMQADPSPPPPPPPPPHQTSNKVDADDDCALAYVLDEDDTPMPDKGALPGLHLANP